MIPDLYYDSDLVTDKKLETIYQADILLYIDISKFSIRDWASHVGECVKTWNNH